MVVLASFVILFHIRYLSVTDLSKYINSCYFSVLFQLFSCCSSCKNVTTTIIIFNLAFLSPFYLSADRGLQMLKWTPDRRIAAFFSVFHLCCDFEWKCLLSLVFVLYRAETSFRKIFSAFYFLKAKVKIFLPGNEELQQFLLLRNKKIYWKMNQLKLILRKS